MANINWDEFTSGSQQPSTPVDAASAAPETKAVDWNQFVTPEPQAPMAAESPRNIAPAEQGHPVDAFLRSGAKGLGNFALDLGGLAGDILKKFETTKGVGEALNKEVKDLRKYTLPTSDVEISNPRASAAGEAIGYGLSGILGPGGIVRTALGPLLSTSAKVAPTITAAAREGLAGAIGGGAMAGEDNRGFGAALGAGVGAPLGAAGSVLGRNVDELAQYVLPEIQKAQSLGFAKNSPEALAAARGALANRGMNQVRENITQSAEDIAQKSINDLLPDNIFTGNKSPNQILIDRASTRFKDVEAQVKERFAPFNELPVKADVSQLNTQARQLPANVKNYLPENPLQNTNVTNLSFSNLQSYRQELDGMAKAARNALTPKEFKAFSDYRRSVSASLDDAAESAGMGPQWQEANAFYRTEYAPFRTLSKATGKLSTPEELDSAWTTINSMMNTAKPNIPNLKKAIGVLGDDGKELVGWAKLQNAINASKTGSEFSLPKFNAKINKDVETGVESLYSTPKFQEVKAGINNIINNSKGIDPTSNRAYIPIVTPVIEHLIQTPTGINLIAKFGQRSITNKIKRAMLQDLLTQAPNVLTYTPSHLEGRLPTDQGNQ